MYEEKRPKTMFYRVVAFTAATAFIACAVTYFLGDNTRTIDFVVAGFMVGQAGAAIALGASD